VLIGLLIAVDPSVSQIAGRTDVRVSDTAIALASGCAGALALTSNFANILVGVMVAVALLPPLVTFGLLLGAGHFLHALDALMLFLTNFICINLAGVVTFLLQGIRPLTWWEADRARKAAHRAIFLWVGLLAALVLVIVLSHSR